MIVVLCDLLHRVLFKSLNFIIPLLKKRPSYSYSGSVSIVLMEYGGKIHLNLKAFNEFL